MCPLLSHFCSPAPASFLFLFSCTFYVFVYDILEPVSDQEHLHFLIYEYLSGFFHSSFFALAEGKSSTRLPCQLVELISRQIH